MTLQILKPCCSELNCHRSQPLRIYREDTTWWIATEYAERDKNGISVVRQRHQVHPDDAAYLDALLDRDTGSGEGKKG